MTQDPIPPHRRTLPDRRKAEYDALDHKIDERFDILTDRVSRWIKKGIIAIGILGLTCAVGLVALGVILRVIQNQRLSVLVTNCEDTNFRNIDVNAKIDAAILGLPKDRQTKARKDSQPFRLIINAAVPYRKDCDAYARIRLKGGHG